MNTEVTELGKHALAEIRFIRAVMERAVRFNAVPGFGLVFMGITACMTALLVPVGHPSWLGGWLIDACAAIGIGVSTMYLKARSAGLSVTSRPGQAFLFSFLPPLLVGAAVTVVIADLGQHQLLPGIWLCIYGLAAVTAGALSVRIVSVMGACFITAGTIALFLPSSAANLMMAVGFGGLHISFGFAIAGKHGG